MLGSDDGCFPVERSWLYLDLRMMACQAMHAGYKFHNENFVFFFKVIMLILTTLGSPHFHHRNINVNSANLVSVEIDN